MPTINQIVLLKVVPEYEKKSRKDPLEAENMPCLHIAPTLMPTIFQNPFDSDNDKNEETYDKSDGILG